MAWEMWTESAVPVRNLKQYGNVIIDISRIVVVKLYPSEQEGDYVYIQFILDNGRVGEIGWEFKDKLLNDLGMEG